MSWAEIGFIDRGELKKAEAKNKEQKNILVLSKLFILEGGDREMEE